MKFSLTLQDLVLFLFASLNAICFSILASSYSRMIIRNLKELLLTGTNYINGVTLINLHLALSVVLVSILYWIMLNEGQYYYCNNIIYYTTNVKHMILELILENLTVVAFSVLLLLICASYYVFFLSVT